MPVAALGQSSIHSDFVPDAVDRVEKIKQGNPLDTETTTGAQASNDQLEKICPASTSAVRRAISPSTS